MNRREHPGAWAESKGLLGEVGPAWLDRIRAVIEAQYEECPTGCGGSFGELLCYEIHSAGLTFVQLAEKWNVSVGTIGALIADHCNRMEPEPYVDHDYRAGGGA